jgi:hypothetical protein
LAAKIIAIIAVELLQAAVLVGWAGARLSPGGPGGAGALVARRSLSHGAGDRCLAASASCWPERSSP